MATSVTVAVVAPLLLLVVGMCIAIGVGWTGVIVAAAVLLVWISEKWWIVLDPDNLLLWLKFLPGIWRWVHEDDPARRCPRPTRAGTPRSRRRLAAPLLVITRRAVGRLRGERRHLGLGPESQPVIEPAGPVVLGVDAEATQEAPSSRPVRGPRP